MTTAIDRFKNRKNLSAQVEVPFPDKEYPTMILEIGRPTTMELSQVTWHVVENKGITREYAQGMLQLIRKYIKNWISEEIPYCEDSVDALFAEMDTNEQITLATGFQEALREDEATAGKNLQTALNTPSKNGSVSA